MSLFLISSSGLEKKSFLTWEKQTLYGKKGGYFQLGMGPKFGFLSHILHVARGGGGGGGKQREDLSLLAGYIE